MASTRHVVLAVLAVAIGIVWLAWDNQSVTLLTLAGALLAAGFAYFSRPLRNVLIPVSVVCLCLSLAEFVLPLISPAADTSAAVVHDRQSGYMNNYYEQIEGFGYRPEPGVHSSRELTLDGEVIYDVTYTIGEDGYRKSRDGEPFAAFLYGGSFTFGEGLNDDQTLVHYLWEDHGFNVKSVGIHGYGLQQALYNISHGLAPADGVAIVLTAPWHALRGSCKPDYAAGTPRYEIAGEYAQLAGVCSGGGFLSRIARNSNVFKLVQFALFNDINRITDTDIALYLAMFKTIARHAHESNSRLLIAYIQGTDDRMQYTAWTNDSLMEQLNEIADIFVDVTLSEQQETLDPMYYIHELDQHPSAEANRVRAGLIVESLTSPQ